MNLWLSAPHV